MPTARYKPEDILDLPGVTVGKSVGEQLKKKATKKIGLLENVFVDDINRWPTWVVGVHTQSMQNVSKTSEIGMRHSKRIAVCTALGKKLAYVVPYAEHFHEGKTLCITLTRLAPQFLDKHDNLPMSMKTILDAICLTMGVNDNSPLLNVIYDQEKSDLYGVRIVLSRGIEW